jgi:hypothetical protein
MGQAGKFCTKCGERLEGRFRFCPACGTTVPDVPGAGEEQAGREGKVTPISPEARRIISTFEAQFEELKTARARREQSPVYIMKNVFSPKLQAVIFGGSLIVFVALFVFLYIMLTKYLQAASNLK